MIFAVTLVLLGLTSAYYAGGGKPDSDEMIEKLASSDYFQSAGYQFLRPDKTYDLPDILVEVSGVTVVDDQTLFCIQDEIGVVFSFDLKSGQTKEVARFSGSGDFEDIVYHNGQISVLRSDGMVFQFPLDDADEVVQKELPIECPDAEGLFFGESSGVWYVACKEGQSSESEKLRQVYAFDTALKGSAKEILQVDQREIKKLLRKKYPELEWDEVKFNPSAVAVHPVSKALYVLSATHGFIAVFESNQLSDIFPLPKKLYHKPEGIDFDQKGNLFLSSEGKKNGKLSGRIYYFEAQ